MSIYVHSFIHTIIRGMRHDMMRREEKRREDMQLTPFHVRTQTPSSFQTSFVHCTIYAVSIRSSCSIHGFIPRFRVRYPFHANFSSSVVIVIVIHSLVLPQLPYMKSPPPNPPNGLGGPPPPKPPPPGNPLPPPLMFLGPSPGPMGSYRAPGGTLYKQPPSANVLYIHIIERRRHTAHHTLPHPHPPTHQM